MGHQLGSKSKLVPLIDRLNRYPVGLVDNDLLRRILTMLFSEEEACIAARFPLEEATLAELARLTGYQPERLLPILERMADKGLIMDLPYGDRVYYLLLPGLIGFFELSFMKQRADLPQAELARLMQEYLFGDPQLGQAREFFGSRTPLTRALAHEEQVPVSSTVTSFESARKIIRQAGFGAVGMCYCRHKQQHLGSACRKQAPVSESCISLGTAARFLVRRGFAEPRSETELLTLLDQFHELGLTHVTDNIRQQPAFICNCCSCCCELLTGVQRGFHAGVAGTGYRVRVDIANCSGCGVCVSACNVKALALLDSGSSSRRKLTVGESGCLGCGVCVPVCSSRALELVPGPSPVIPATRRQLMLRILKEKGRLRPYLVGAARKKLRSWLSLDD